MFRFEENIKSHMPFAAHGNAPDFAPKQFCCIMINGKWKIHHYDNGVWKRVYTGLPEDATECSPTAEYDPASGKWRVSYIVGGFDGGREYKLYLIADLDNPSPEAVMNADVGFVFKKRIVFGGRMGPIFISESGCDRMVKFLDAEYLYRVSYNPNNPSELLISGQREGGEIFSRIYDISTRKLYGLSVNGEAAYKAALFDDECYYAHRGDAEGFEDRHIVKADAFTRTELSSDLVLEFDI